MGIEEGRERLMLTNSTDQTKGRVEQVQAWGREREREREREEGGERDSIYFLSIKNLQAYILPVNFF